MLYSTKQMKECSEEMHGKYLSDLGDSELDNFSEMYKQALNN